MAETTPEARPDPGSRTVVIAMDGSEHSDYALDWYSEHVFADGDKVVIVFVPELHEVLHSSSWTPPLYQVDKEVLGSMVQQEHDRIKGQLDTFADKLKHHNLGGKVESILAKKPGEGILKAVESEHADLIIMGSRGQNKLRRTFMGSISDYVVHHSHIPVLVCKHPHKHTPAYYATHPQ